MDEVSSVELQGSGTSAAIFDAILNGTPKRHTTLNSEVPSAPSAS
jgi:hypothetical protein